MALNLQELTTLVAGGESERVEFKKTTGQRSEAMRTGRDRLALQRLGLVNPPKKTGPGAGWTLKGTS